MINYSSPCDIWHILRSFCFVNEDFIDIPIAMGGFSMVKMSIKKGLTIVRPFLRDIDN